MGDGMNAQQAQQNAQIMWTPTRSLTLQWRVGHVDKSLQVSLSVDEAEAVAAFVEQLLAARKSQQAMGANYA